MNTGKAGVLKQGLELRLQRNILEKYRTDEEAVTKNLVKKRQEFEQRVNICKEKQGELAVRQKQVNLIMTILFFHPCLCLWLMFIFYKESRPDRSVFSIHK